MSPDDSTTSDADGDSRASSTDTDGFTVPGSDRLGDGADRAIEEFDKRLVDLLAWLLDTETRARLYIHLRQSPGSTSDEIAEGTGLYPSTVREAIVELHDEGIVTRTKRQNGGAGNNPYEYEAIPPSELVASLAEQVQAELNAVFCLDDYLEGDEDGEPQEAVHIEIDAPSDA